MRSRLASVGLAGSKRPLASRGVMYNRCTSSSWAGNVLHYHLAGVFEVLYILDVQRESGVEE